MLQSDIAGLRAEDACGREHDAVFLEHAPFPDARLLGKFAVDRFHNLQTCRIPWWQGKMQGISANAIVCERISCAIEQGIFCACRELVPRFGPEQGIWAKLIRALGLCRDVSSQRTRGRTPRPCWPAILAPLEPLPRSRRSLTVSQRAGYRRTAADASRRDGEGSRAASFWPVGQAEDQAGRGAVRKQPTIRIDEAALGGCDLAADVDHLAFCAHRANFGGDPADEVHFEFQ